MNKYYKSQARDMHITFHKSYKQLMSEMMFGADSCQDHYDHEEFKLNNQHLFPQSQDRVDTKYNTDILVQDIQNVIKMVQRVIIIMNNSTKQ